MTSISHLSTLTRLTCLELGGNELRGILQLFSLARLAILSVEDNAIESLQGLESLTGTPNGPHDLWLDKQRRASIPAAVFGLI